MGGLRSRRFAANRWSTLRRPVRSGLEPYVATGERRLRRIRLADALRAVVPTEVRHENERATARTRAGTSRRPFVVPRGSARPRSDPGECSRGRAWPRRAFRSKFLFLERRSAARAAGGRSPLSRLHAGLVPLRSSRFCSVCSMECSIADGRASSARPRTGAAICARENAP